MIAFSDEMIIGATVIDAQDAIEKLKENISVFNLYIIFIDKSSGNLIEITRASQMFKPFLSMKNIIIIGMANGREEAMDIVLDLIKLNIDKITNSKLFKEKF